MLKRVSSTVTIASAFPRIERFDSNQQLTASPFFQIAIPDFHEIAVLVLNNPDLLVGKTHRKRDRAENIVAFSVGAGL